MKTHAVVCACGRRLEYETVLAPRGDDFELLRTPTHDPDECSRRVGFEDKLDGAQRMAEIAVEHLLARKTLGGAEIAEIRTVLTDRAIEVLR